MIPPDRAEAAPPKPAGGNRLRPGTVLMVLAAILATALVVVPLLLFFGVTASFLPSVKDRSSVTTGDLAAAIVSGSTSFLAIFTARLARDTCRAVAATQDEAQIARDAVEQARIQAMAAWWGGRSCS